MNRRKFLAVGGGGVLVGVSGCIDELEGVENDGHETDDTAENDEEKQRDGDVTDDTVKNGDEDAGDGEEEYVHGYWIHIDSREERIDDSKEVCKFADLPHEAQNEFEQALEEEDYRMEEEPKLLEIGCHNKYLRYEGEYYLVGVSVDSG